MYSFASEKSCSPLPFFSPPAWGRQRPVPRCVSPPVVLMGKRTNKMLQIEGTKGAFLKKKLFLCIIGTTHLLNLYKYVR